MGKLNRPAVSASASAGSVSGEGLLARLDDLRAILTEIQAHLDGSRNSDKEAFTPSEFGGLTGLSAYTVQDHCRTGRLRATKALSGRGATRGWRISRDELSRYRREGLLPRAGEGC